jgi:hypothetical protein
VCLEAVSPPLAAPRRPRRTRHALSPRPFLPIAGTTMTLALVSGWLVTIANTGDSSAGIDTGNHTSEITVSHRIQVTKGCRRRALRAPPRASGPRVSRGLYPAAAGAGGPVGAAAQAQLRAAIAASHRTGGWLFGAASAPRAVDAQPEFEPTVVKRSQTSR